MDYNSATDQHEAFDEQMTEPVVLRTSSRVQPIALIRLLWERRAFLWRLVWRTAIVATIVAFLLPKTWTSFARLMPPDQSTSGLGALAALTSFGSRADSVPGLGTGGGIASELLGGKNNGALFMGVLRSRTVQDRLIDRFDLRRVYSVSTYENARKVLADRTDIVEDRRSGILSVTVRDRDPRRARDMATAYVNELDRLMAEVSTSSARRERIFLEQRLGAVKADLDLASKQLSEFSSKNATLDLNVQGKAMLEAAATLQGELIAAESQLRGLEAIYAPSNVRVRSLRARISELQSQLQKLGGSSTKPDKAEGDEALYPSIRQLPVLGLTYLDLYRRAKIEEAVFETLTKQYELAKVQEAKEIPTVRVLDVPLVPEKKTSPKRLQIIFAASFLAFLIGVTWLAARMKWEALDPADPRKLLLEEVFGTVRASLSGPGRPVLQTSSVAEWWNHRRRRT
jgi:capsule polysaccharide export protein KpsE/RkpR